MRADEQQFIKSLNRVPATELYSAIERECQMLEREACGKRRPLDEAAISVLTFRRFINAVMLGVHLTHTFLPAEHIAAYQKSIARLVKAGRLPMGADKEFSMTFSSAQKLAKAHHVSGHGISRRGTKEK